eukprot:SAG31_NODE_2487_length_5621_cov_4.415248_2_plen_46_part_00
MTTLRIIDFACYGLQHRVTAEQMQLNLGTEASVPVCPMPGTILLT